MLEGFPEIVEELAEVYPVSMSLSAAKEKASVGNC